MAGVDVEGFITDQLDRAGIEYRLRPNFVDVSCIFHAHSGKKKKLGFSRQNGGMHCFVCDKSGHWNEYAETMGLATFGDDDRELQDFAWLRKEFELLTDERRPTNPDWLRPWTEEWRGVDPRFLATIPSYKWYDDASKASRILWPVFVNGSFKGCTAARIRPDDRFVFPRVRNLGGMDSKKVLFPFDHDLVKAARAVVLVEGQYDALRLLSMGVPALSIIGTGAWDRHKLNLLAARGVERIVTAFDGDLAGERATDRVLEDARGEFDVRTMHFPDPNEDELEAGIDRIDPGNCRVKYVRLLGRLCAA